MNSQVVEHQLRLQRVGDHCQSRHLFEIGCHVLLDLVIEMKYLINQYCLLIYLYACAHQVNKVKLFLNIF